MIGYTEEALEEHYRRKEERRLINFPPQLVEPTVKEVALLEVFNELPNPIVEDVDPPPSKFKYDSNLSIAENQRLFVEFNSREEDVRI